MEFNKDGKVPRWKGKIYTGEFMRWSDMVSWEEAVEEARKLGENASLGKFYDKLLPVAVKFIERAEIKDLPEKLEYKDIPASPKFVAFLIESVTKLYEITNEDAEEKKAPEPS